MYKHLPYIRKYMCETRLIIIKCFSVRSTLNLKCYWGGKTCAKWTNRIIQQSSCDDPELGYLDLGGSTDRFCDNDMQTQLDWIELGNRRIGFTRTSRKIWLVFKQ